MSFYRRKWSRFGNAVCGIRSVESKWCNLQEHEERQFTGCCVEFVGRFIRFLHRHVSNESTACHFNTTSKPLDIIHGTHGRFWVLRASRERCKHAVPKNVVLVASVPFERQTSSTERKSRVWRTFPIFKLVVVGKTKFGYLFL